MIHNQATTIGIAWYRREDYARLKKLFEDGHKLPTTYDQWLKRANKYVDELSRTGKIVVKARIDPDHFIDWCRSEGLNVDANARMHFANIAAFRSQGQTH